ncbi:MAG TPA: ceramidase domain-containing protein [Burkholderiales bacterium]|nr:ceramidase domain-containing protein [Burkholderiales bacterium]
MNWQQALDLYCERTDASFWSEPLNALSNAAFLVAAVLLARRARADGGRAPRDIDALAVLIALIGFGSFTFHTVATVWASLLDVLFIQIYIYVYLARYLRRIVGVNLVWMYGGLVLYWLFEQAVTGGFEPGALNGSYRYLPALLALAGMTLYARRVHVPAAAPLAVAVGLLCVSIVLRTIDLGVCHLNPLGTHFFWHLINAAVLYYAAVALLRSEAAGRYPRPI